MGMNGERIAKARDALGLTQTELAELVGVSGAYISQLESGKRTGSWEVLCAIADTLGLTMDELRSPVPSVPAASHLTEVA